MFFGEVLSDLTPGDSRRFVVSASRNTFRGQTNLQLIGYDYEARS